MIYLIFGLVAFIVGVDSYAAFGGALFPKVFASAWLLGFLVIGVKGLLVGARLLTTYLEAGIQAEARNHPRKAGIMWDNVRLGWIPMPRENLLREARYGSAPAYDHELPEKIATAVAGARRRNSVSASEDVS